METVFLCDIEKMCRTCLKEQDELISLFETDFQLGENIQICDIIKNMTAVEVS